jgi:hypothetical protein
VEVAVTDQKPGPPQPESPRYAPSPAQWTLAGLVVALGLGALIYRLLHRGRLEETAALFIGLPTVLALVLALSRPAKSPTGMIMKGMTIALLLSGPILGEGFICIVMAAPLFYLVGAVVGAVVDARRRRQAGAESKAMLPAIVLLPLALMSAEGVLVSFPRSESVTVEAVVTASPDAVRAALAAAPAFDAPLPHYFRLGFPAPVRAAGAGLAVGDRREIVFEGAGMPRLILEVARSEDGRVAFRAVGDETMIARWLHWRDSDVRWEPAAGGATRVRWTLTYERRLDPAWYFGPWQRYAVRLAAAHLIQTAATPR